MEESVQRFVPTDKKRQGQPPQMLAGMAAFGDRILYFYKNSIPQKWKTAGSRTNCEQVSTFLCTCNSKTDHHHDGGVPVERGSLSSGQLSLGLLLSRMKTAQIKMKKMKTAGGCWAAEELPVQAAGLLTEAEFRAKAALLLAAPASFPAAEEASPGIEPEPETGPGPAGPPRPEQPGGAAGGAPPAARAALAPDGRSPRDAPPAPPPAPGATQWPARPTALRSGPAAGGLRQGEAVSAFAPAAAARRAAAPPVAQ
jgi:hypothetical protein